MFKKVSFIKHLIDIIETISIKDRFLYLARASASAMVLVLTSTQFSQAQIPQTQSAEQTIDSTNETDEPVSGIDTFPQDTLPQLDLEPKLITFVKADYPVALQKAGIQGTVHLALLVSEEGTVDSVGIITACHPLLDKNAADAAHKFVFTPAQSYGEPVAVLLEYAYKFTLDEAVQRNDTAINFSGRLLEKGTRTVVPDAFVSIEFEDTSSDTSLPVPFSMYLASIGTYANQTYEAGKLVTSTDSLGYFAFRAVPACSVLVTCVAPGCELFWQREIMLPNNHLSVLYHLQRESHSDNEIIVYGKAYDQSVSRHQLTKNEVKQIPGVGGDAVKVVQTLPGVGRPTMGNGDIIVRGSRPWDSGYFLNGLRIPLLYHFDGIKSIYNAEALEGVNFYPGGTDVRHGGYTAGIVELVPRTARTDRFHGFAELNAMDAQFYMEGPVHKNISILISARRSFFGELLSMLFDKLDDWGENPPMWMLPFYWDFLVRADAHIKNSHTFSLSAFGARDSLSMIFNDRRGNAAVEAVANKVSQSQIFTMLTADWKWNITPTLKNTLRYGLLFDKSNYSAFGDVKMQRKGLSHQINNELSLTLSDHISLYPGIDILLNPLNFTLLSPDGTGIIRGDTLTDWLFGVVGCYLFAECEITEKLKIFPGLRFDYYPELSYNGSIIPQFGPYGEDAPVWRGSGEPSIRVSAQYKVNDKHTVKAAIGTYSQTAQPAGWAIHPTWGNPNLPSTKASHYVLGYLWNVTDLFSIDVQSYINYQWDIPRLDTINSSAMDRQSWLCDVEGRMFGMELMLRYLNGNHFFGWLSYTLSRSERKNRTQSKWELFEEDIPHYLQLVGGVHLPLHWDAGIRLQYASGKPQTPVIGRRLNENNQTFIPVHGAPLSDRTDPYFTLGLRFEHARAMKHFNFYTFIDLPDLLGTFYASPEFFVYNYDYTERKTFSMPPIIMAGLRIEY